MIYNISGHPLLGTTAKELATKNPAKFQALVDLSADVLGIADLDEDNLENGEEDRLNRGLAINVNYLLALDPNVFIMIQESSSASSQNRTFREVIPLASPLAVVSVKPVLDNHDLDGYDNLTSVRSSVR